MLKLGGFQLEIWSNHGDLTMKHQDLTKTKDVNVKSGDKFCLEGNNEDPAIQIANMTI